MKVLREPAACDGCDGNHVIVKSCFVGEKYQYSYGLSVYFPWSRIDDDYLKDEFAVTTGWSEFLELYVATTRREMRAGSIFQGGTALQIEASQERERIRLEYQPNLPLTIVKHRDPPEGRGLTIEYERAKNPPSTWQIPECVAKLLK
jgi:hypothetical protein